MENRVYDVAIIGGGPAGLTAALYTGRARLSVIVIEKSNIGSLILAHKIENYPGVGKLTGKELYNQMKEQTKEFNVEYLEANFLGFSISNNIKIVKTDLKNIECKSIIIATGWNKNNNNKIEGEEKYIGKGVSYCATCDGAFTRNMVSSLFGKGEEILEEALFLTKYSKEINIFITEDKIDITNDIYDTLNSNEKVKFYYSAKLLEIKGDEFVEEINVEIAGEKKTIKTEFVFLYLGTKQSSEIYSEVAKLDSNGYILTDELMQTGKEGVFAAGDVRSKAIKQVTTATSDGTIAGMEAIKYILKKKKEKN